MIRLEMLCTPTLISETAPYLSSVAKAYGIPPREAKRLCFVVESIMDMRMRELEKNDPTLVVEARIERHNLVVSITDKGLPYVLTSNEKKALKAGLANSYLFEQLGAEGQRISLYFEMVTQSKAPLVPTVEEEALLDTNFTCRLTTDSDEDIIRVIQCIYTAYGYNYLHQELYRTDVFKSMLHGGGYLSVLVENEHHQVVGHIALEEHAWFPGIMEACNLVVKPMARGNDLASVLVRDLLERGERRNLRGIYGMPVMFHPISQILLGKHGFTPCGMYFHILPGEAIKGRKIDSGRVDTAFCVHVYDKTTPHPLYLPSECAAFIQDVFQKEQLSFSLSGGEESVPASTSTSVSYKVDTVSKLLEVKVDAIGADLSARLNNPPFEKDLAVVEVITVYLNMNDPCCPVGYRTLKELGFIFCGCLPGSSAHDYAIMQHLREQPVVKENIVAQPDYAEMLNKLYAINGL